jgi:hypothetical protein
MYQLLIGRQYYATVSQGVVSRFTQLNAEVLDDENAPLTLHCEDFATEAASADCAGTDSGPCYAYVAVDQGDTVSNGADDMNHCLYQDEIDDPNDVANKYGAGATFGPTIADIVEDYQRDGTLAAAQDALDYISGYMNDAYDTYNGGDFDSDGNKEYADSHYFAVPAPNPFDISTSFAFIFPLQHFIGERNLITPIAIWDNEENKQEIQLGKFISPGLPTASTPGEEAALFKLAAPFAEGWIRFAITATNATLGCEESLTDSTSCEVTNSGSPADTYVPAYTGAVFNMGSQHISASHFQYNNDSGSLND